MVTSQNNGTPIWAPKYYSPSYGDAQEGYPSFTELPYLPKRTLMSKLANDEGPDGHWDWCSLRLVMRLTLPQADMEANIVPIEKVLFFVLT